jgi:hypothetical protein
METDLEVWNMNPRDYTRSEAGQQPDAYKEFDATELYCPNCRQAVPVRKHLLLVLPEGDKYEYRCVYCAASVGTKMDHQQKPLSLIL